MISGATLHRIKKDENCIFAPYRSCFTAQGANIVWCEIKSGCNGKMVAYNFNPGRN